MTVKTIASVKSFFEAGDRPTEQNFVDLIDSTYNSEIVVALASAAGAGQGVVKITSASAVTLVDASAGNALLESGTRASARSVLGATTVGSALFTATDAAAGRTALELGTAAVLDAGDLPLPRGYIDGLTLSNNATDANNDIDVAEGESRSDDNTANLALSATMTKRLDAVWAAGTGNGGLDTGTKANSTWYHVWLIGRTDTGAVDVLFSTSATAPTMPTSYDSKRRIGSIKTNGSGNITAFSQKGDEFLLDVPVADIDETAPSDATELKTLASVPTGVKVTALAIYTLFEGGDGIDRQGMILSPDQTETAPSSTLHDIRAKGPDAFNSVYKPTRTNTSAQIFRYLSGAGATTIFRATVHGWIDPRGKS